MVLFGNRFSSGAHLLLSINLIIRSPHPQNTEWPNNIYREFIEIVMEYQLSNSCGNRIIKLIDKSRCIPDENRLPKSIKEGCKFLDVNEFPYMKFKTVPITNF